jgi:hypothetical protein
MEMEFKCERCKPGHDFKNKHYLKQHHQSASHKRKFDTEFAAAEEAEKVRKKAARGGKETARKAGDKEKARLANRGQRDDNTKRKRSKAEKDERQRAFSKIQYRKQTDGDPAPWITGNGTEEDALKALVRYHGSTSVACLITIESRATLESLCVSVLKLKQR